MPAPVTGKEFGDWLRNSTDSPFRGSRLTPIGRPWKVDGIKVFGARTDPYEPEEKQYVAFEGEKVVGYLKVTNFERETYAEAMAYGKPVEFGSTGEGSSEKPLGTFRKALKERKPTG